MTKSISLQPGNYYHIFNRGNNRENIFIQERNYYYFLQLYTSYNDPVAETFAYCLLRNHFHLLVRIKDMADSPLTPSQHFSHLFNAYPRTINRTYQRSGALFQRPFDRIAVTSDSYFLQLIAYIHQNPQKHGFVKDFRDWPYSSYQPLSSTRPTHLRRDEVLAWFDGVEQFVDFHQEKAKETQIAVLIQEDID
ncbi:MAG: transposase [Anaerolineales bacterium]|nr:transposase [Anaerolineales bacterium]